MRTIFNMALLGAGLAALALSAPLSAAPARAGKPTAKAQGQVHKPAAGANRNQQHAGNRPQGGQRQGGQYAGGNQGGKRGNNVVAGNTVVVGGNPGRGYYDNGRYHGSPDWDDNDNDFLEFVGKTAAITAGVSVVTAVIGSTVNDKPDDCQPVVSGGQQYLYCNGTYYSAVSNGYQVVAPPR